MARWLPWLERLFAAVATALTVYCVYLASDFTTMGLELYGLSILICGCCAFALLVRIIYSWCQPKGNRVRALRAGTATVLGPLVIFALSVALIELDVPSQLRFDWSRTELESVAKATRERWRDNDTAGIRVGLFRIVGIDPQDDGRILLDLGGCAFFDRCYLMYDADANAQPPSTARARLADHWWLLREGTF